MEKKIKRKDLKYEESKYKFDFQQYEMIRSFRESIYAGKISIHEAGMGQNNLLENIVKFDNRYSPKNKKVKNKRRNTFDSVSALYEGWELTLNAFRSEIFPIKEKQGKWLKILTRKEMLLRLPITLAHVKAGNTSENLLN